MKDFVAIDVETGNRQRVSVCSLGYAKVIDGQIVETKGYIIKPIGGHEPFQTNFHKLTDEHTHDKPYFNELFPEIKWLFDYPIVSHGMIDKQALNALSNYFDLNLKFSYTDSAALAKEKLPNLKNHELKRVAKHFQLPPFKHHDAEEDAITCAKIYLKLQNCEPDEAIPIKATPDYHFFRGFITGILADDVINGEEFEALYLWMKKHSKIAMEHRYLYRMVKEIVECKSFEIYPESVIEAELKRCL